MEKVLIVASEPDPASMNIKERLLKNFNFEEDPPFFKFKNFFLYTIKDEHLYHNHIDREVAEFLGESPGLVIFISKHSSKNGIDCLTCHPVGNYGKAELGGFPEKVVPSAPIEMTEVLRGMFNSGYRASFECTHHGPFLSTPSFFIEIGSDLHAWKNKAKADVIAKAIINKISKISIEKNKNVIKAVVLGGGHYMPAPTEVVKRKQVVFGHMIPDYFLHVYPRCLKIINEQQKIERVYLDKKALKKRGFRLVGIRKSLDSLGFKEIRSSELPEIRL